MSAGGPEILLVEDDAALADLIRDELETGTCRVVEAPALAEARRLLALATPQLLICDLNLPDGNGMDLVNEVLRQPSTARRPAVMVITAFGSVRQAVAALQAGADDFLTKPLDMDHFRIAVQRVLETHRLRDEVTRFRAAMANDDFHGLYGRSKPMERLREQVRVIAHANGPVLVLGESGTGKELVARAIHAESDRAQGPFLAVNCAGIPAELLESEFFGHRQGAFSGARQARKGLLQEADGGTLMLDEIGEMPVALQAKLLRALEDGSMRPVGADREVKVDVRIVAATHQDLPRKVRDGEFREDLYYRLEAFALLVPPLRERSEDIPLLARRFLAVFCLEQGRDDCRFTNAALARLSTWAFPGNVRELKNVVERALAFCRGNEIGVEELPERIRRSVPQAVEEDGRASSTPTLEALLEANELPTMEQVQRRYARFVLERVGGNKQRAAALLDIGRRTLYRWLEE